MNVRFLSLIILCLILKNTAAQQNWAAVTNCVNNKWPINKLFVDSLHDELILNSSNGYGICGVNYKGLFAFNGYNFRDLDKGVETHDPNPSVGGLAVSNCITYGNKTLFGGGFTSVGSNVLYSKSLALWNGAVWDTFPKHCFSNALNGSGGGFQGFLKWNNKLWMYGAFDTIGGVISKNICSFDGNSFNSVPTIPSYNNDNIIGSAIVYKNKLIVTGDFYDQTSWSARVAMYDGNSWSSVGTGIKGNASFVNTMTIYKDTLYIAGSWPKSAGNVSNHIMKWDGNQLSDAGFGNYYGYDAIASLVVYKNRLFAFGNFKHAANQKAYGIAYYESGAWTVPQDSIYNAVIQSGAVYKNELYIAGYFHNVNKDTTIRNFAKLRCDNFDYVCTTGLNENKLNTLSVRLFPNPVSGKLKIELNEINTANLSMDLLNGLGEILDSKTYSVNLNEFDLTNLPKGIYFLRVRDSQASKVFKVIKD